MNDRDGKAIGHIDALALRVMGRRVGHLTPRYAIDRCFVWLYQRQHRDAPWLTAQAISVLSTALRESDKGVEWGSGRSTLWLAKRTGFLTSAEHSPLWYERVRSEICKQNLTNVHYRYFPVDPNAPEEPAHSEYIVNDSSLSTGSVDYALVDGYFRDECALRATELLKSGGILILDNANWYIPHPTRSPGSVSTLATPLWREFLSRVAKWRTIWTSNGVWDTALWFKTD